MKRARKSAFSLVELSVVLLIISILVAGTITVSTAMVNKSKTENTKQKMKEIYDAMGAYLLKNYALPCPAPLNVVKSTAGYGVAGAAGSCNADGIYASTLQSSVVYGMVPVNTLGLPSSMAEDEFGSKIAYVINKKYTIVEYPTATDNGGFSFYLGGGSGAIRAYELPSTNYIDDLMFMLISFGANKYGAFNASAAVQNGASADVSEAKNQLSSITNNSFPTADTASFGVNSAHPSNVTFTISSAASDVFDDISLFKSRADMMIDFNAMFLAGCDDSSLNMGSGFSNAFYGQIKNKNSACASPNTDITPSKKCGAFGARWIDMITCP